MFGVRADGSVFISYQSLLIKTTICCWLIDDTYCVDEKRNTNKVKHLIRECLPQPTFCPRNGIFFLMLCRLLHQATSAKGIYAIYAISGESCLTTTYLHWRRFILQENKSKYWQSQTWLQCIEIPSMPNWWCRPRNLNRRPNMLFVALLYRL